MKKELNEHREVLIDTIQQKLSQLRKRRNQMEGDKQEKLNNVTKSDDDHNFQILEAKQKTEKISEQQKLELKNKTDLLSELYHTKKYFSSIGINANDPNRIIELKNNTKHREYLEKKRKIAEQQNEKNKIIKEEMKRTQKFLKNKNISNKELGELQVMNYKYLFAEKKQELRQYQQLLKKGSLSRFEKDELIHQTFKLIMEWNRKVRIQYLKKFLKANSEFCRHFFITAAEINRDLDVHSSEENGFLNEREFHEFIKSIELTNPNINPSLKNKMRRDKKENKKHLVNEQILKEEKKEEPSLKERKIKLKKENKDTIQYFRKVFKELDKLSEGIVERKVFIRSIQKGFLLPKGKDVTLSFLKQFVSFLEADLKEKQSSTYYKELDSRYISFVEIKKLFESFWKQRIQKQEVKDKEKEKEKEMIDNLDGQDSQQEKENKYKNSEDQGQDQEQKQEPQSEESFKIDKDGNITSQDYERYGWGLNHVPPSYKESNIHQGLKNIDQFSKKVGKKYMAEIEWEGYDHYKADFSELQAFIHHQEKKMK